MDEQVMRQHIDLYVNNYSISLEKDGKQSVKTLLKTYSAINGLQSSEEINVID